MCVYIFLMDGEDESLSVQRLFKDPRWRIAEISWVLGVRKPKKKIKQPLHHHMLFGRVSRKILLAPPKTNSSIFSGQTRLDLQMAQGSVVRWEAAQGSVVRWDKIKSFLAANTLDGFDGHEDKKYPMCTI